MRVVKSAYVGVLFAVLGSPALAQDLAPADEQARGQGQLQEIIVTAQRRAENLQDVPVAVSVVSAAAIEGTGSNNLIDLSALVPGLNLRNSASFLATSLRGVGSTGKGPGVENPTALYVDGVYMGSAGTSMLSFNSIEQIAVLKGPQGTLFGRNATGGLIQVTTRDPSQNSGGDFSIGLANYGTVTANAYLGGRIADGVFADIAFYGSNQAEGWGFNHITGQDVYKVDHDYAIRSKWVLEPAEGTKLTLIGDYADRKDSMIALYVHPGTVSLTTPNDPVPNVGYDIYTDTQPVVKLYSGGVSLRLDQELGNLELSTITAYRQARTSPLLEYDGTRVPGADVNPAQLDKQFSQEVQLSSAGSGPLKWVAGAYYYDASGHFDPFTLLTGNKTTQIQIWVTQSTKSFAGYGQFSYELESGTTLTLGGRYTTEERKVYGLEQTITNLVTGTVIALSDADRKATFDKFTFRVSLDQRISGDVMGYASFNRGFKSGGYNANVFGSAPYRPEVLDAYEVGLKMDLFDRMARFNLAAFYYEYKDMQEQRRTAGATTVINAGKSRIYGIEGELTAELGNGLSLVGGFSLLDPKYITFDNCPFALPGGGVPTTAGDCAGNMPGMASKFTGNLGLNYRADVGSGQLDLNTNLYYNSGFYMQPDNAVKQDSYATWNAAARYTLSSGAYIGVFGRNLTNNRTINNNATGPDGTQWTYFSAPRTYGALVGYNF